MAPVRNGRLLFNEIPTGYPVPGKTTVYDASQTIDLESAPLDGGFLVKVLVLSVDPYLRGRMRDSSIKSYSPAFLIGQPLDNFGVGIVVRSEHAQVKPGDHIYGYLPFQEYVIRENLSGYRILENKEKLPWSVYVGAAGMPGQTAYYGWKEYAHPQKGDTVFVSTGAGLVGSFVIQLAKGDGLKVVGSTGSDEKVDFMKSIGTDVTFNYKAETTADVLEKEGPINIYWDNVGGETLDAALGAAGVHGRFIECGMISTYNDPQPRVYKNIVNILVRQLKVTGFIVTALAPKYEDEFYREVPKRIASGEIKYQEDITKGLEYAGHAILDVQTGKNKGKSVVLVAEE